LRRVKLTNHFFLGGGIVFDSDPYEEYVETLNKLGANMQCITSAERIYAGRQSAGNGEALSTKPLKEKVHIDLAAG
jgi:anthranilate synthase component 1